MHANALDIFGQLEVSRQAARRHSHVGLLRPMPATWTLQMGWLMRAQWRLPNRPSTRLLQRTLRERSLTKI